jgi:hypothetical protein
LRAQILEAASQQPTAIWDLFKDAEVRKALLSLGVLTTVFELHASGAKGRGSQRNLGRTLCNHIGRRHPTVVTCKRCLSKIEVAALVKAAFKRTVSRRPKAS